VTPTTSSLSSFFWPALSPALRYVPASPDWRRLSSKVLFCIRWHTLNMATSDSTIHAVAAGIMVCSGEVLLCRRSLDRAWFPGVWDLPGGHIEPGESPQAALVRELREEIGVNVRMPMDDCHSRLSTEDFDMQLCVISEWNGDPTIESPDEHDEISWFSETLAVGLDLAHPSYRSLIWKRAEDRAPAERVACVGTAWWRIPYRRVWALSSAPQTGTLGRVDSASDHTPTDPWSGPRSVAGWRCSQLPDHRDRQVRQTPSRPRVHPYGGARYRPFRRTFEEFRVDDLGL
jgi:mutator protein MutT